MTDLSYPGGRLRLYVEVALGEGARVEPSPAQSHYLLHVMRAKAGDRVALFNGADGEWRATLADLTKRGCALVCEEKVAAQTPVPDLWPVFAPSVCAICRMHSPETPNLRAITRKVRQSFARSARRRLTCW